MPQLEFDAEREALGRIGWAHDIDPAFRVALFDRLRFRSFGPDEAIQLGGSERMAFIGLASGQMGLWSARSAPDATIAHILQPGWWIGDAGMTGMTALVHAVARTPAVVGFIQLAALRSLLYAEPRWYRDRYVHSQRVSVLSATMIGDMNLHDVHRRAAATLLRFAGHRPVGLGATLDELVLTQFELGEAITVSRNTSHQVIGDLEREGMIACGYRRIRLLDIAALRALADGEREA